MTTEYVSTAGGAAVGGYKKLTRQAANSVSGKQNNLAGGGDSYRRGVGQAEVVQARLAADAAKPKPPPPKPPEQNKPPEESKKAAKVGVNAEGGSHNFPLDFPFQYFMVLKFAAYDRNTVFEDASKDHDLFISLPVPANLGESFGINVGKQAFGVFLGEVGKVVNDTLQGRNNGQDLGKSFSTAVADSIKNARESGTISNVLANRLTGGFSETAAAGVDMILGTTPNPNLAVNFQGVPLRTFGFSWRFAPRSVAESQELIDIIFKLKQRMLPGKAQYVLTYPDHCEIAIHSWQSAGLRELIKFKTSFLTDIKVNYAPSGVPSFFAGTSMPTEMELSLTFQETKIFTREDFMKRPVLQKQPAADL
jgi:hypothetical protein